MSALSNMAGLLNYWAVIVLMMIGLYIMISRGNLVKKLMGMNIFQVSVIMFYVSMGKVTGGTPPILIEGRDDGVERIERTTQQHPNDLRIRDLRLCGAQYTWRIPDDEAGAGHFQDMSTIHRYLL